MESDRLPHLPAQTRTMQPWPGLASFGSSLGLGRRRAPTFIFDSALSGAGTSGAAGSPLLLIHGLGDEADTWRHVFHGLSKDRRVIALDLPGFGRSAAAGHVGLSACAERVILAMEKLAPDGAVLLGSSLGAAVAQLAAIRAPGKVRGLILVGGGLPLPRSTFGTLRAMLLPIFGEIHYTRYRTRHEAAFASLAPYYANLDASAGYRPRVPPSAGHRSGAQQFAAACLLLPVEKPCRLGPHAREVFPAEPCASVRPAPRPAGCRGRHLRRGCGAAPPCGDRERPVRGNRRRRASRAARAAR